MCFKWLRLAQYTILKSFQYASLSVLSYQLRGTLLNRIS